LTQIGDGYPFPCASRPRIPGPVGVGVRFRLGCRRRSHNYVEDGKKNVEEFQGDINRLGRRKQVSVLNDDWTKANGTRRSILFTTRTAILIALTLVIQMMGMPQYATGPLVNTMLYVATVFVGILGGVAIGLITPVIAFWRGILPPPLGPMIPFIALGNAVLVITYGLIEKRNKYVAVIAASVIKYLVLSGAVRFLVAVPPKIAQMMQVPQLITALAGGAIAILLSEILIRRGTLKPLSHMKFKE
jgi:hypothetical protein